MQGIVSCRYENLYLVYTCIYMYLRYFNKLAMSGVCGNECCASVNKLLGLIGHLLRNARGQRKHSANTLLAINSPFTTSS